jgi:hypothetical protein
VSRWQRLNAWADRHWRLLVVADALFLVGFWTIAVFKNEGWGYALAIGWTLRTAFEWWRDVRKRRDHAAAAPPT